MTENNNGFIVSIGGACIDDLRTGKRYLDGCISSEEFLSLEKFVKRGSKFLLYMVDGVYSLVWEVGLHQRLKNLVRRTLGHRSSVISFDDAIQFVQSKMVLKLASYDDLANDTDELRKKGLNINVNVNEFEILPHGVSKFKALKHIEKISEISVDNIVYFGDGENDIECLKNCGYSFAMSNANDAVRKCAKKITVFDNNHDGIWHELKSII